MIIVIIVLLWGPEKLPEVARKAARVIHFMRQVANNAQTTVRTELGPGFEDFDIRDPKGSVRRYVMKQGELDGVNDMISTLREATDELDSAAADMRRAMDMNNDGVVDDAEMEAGRQALAASGPAAAPFDTEAT